MKKIVTLCLTAGMLLGAATGASAIDFAAKGQWNIGMGLVDTRYEDGDPDDNFTAMQRVRLQIDAIASESLSGTLSIEIGDSTWGSNGGGAALGADQRVIEVRNAYLDWIVPNTELSVRMGIQPLTLPNVAGGSAVHDDMTAGIVMSYKVNDMASVGFAWARPYNDNYTGRDNDGAALPGFSDSANFLDNVDLFTLFVPLQGDGWKVTPWLLGGVVGKNAVQNIVVNGTQGNGGAQGAVASGLLPTAVLFSAAPNLNGLRNMMSENSYATSFWAGLPMGFQHDAWNFELDINYGSISGFGEGDMAINGRNEKVSLDRDGWLIKGLVEYQMDWGTPGLFAWYGSGDDDDLANGSEMMPYLNPCGNFTSFIGDGNVIGYSIYTGSSLGYDQMMNYSGTWGFGLQLANMSFTEDLKHTLRVAYWGGTNSTAMAKYIGNAATGGNNPFGGVGAGGFYLTTADSLVEVNFDSSYQIYENLTAYLQLGYIFNNVSHDTWDNLDGKRDGYRADVVFSYSF